MVKCETLTLSKCEFEALVFRNVKLYFVSSKKHKGNINLVYINLLVLLLDL